MFVKILSEKVAVLVTVFVMIFVVRTSTLTCNVQTKITDSSGQTTVVRFTQVCPTGWKCFRTITGSYTELGCASEVLCTLNVVGECCDNSNFCYKPGSSSDGSTQTCFDTFSNSNVECFLSTLIDYKCYTASFITEVKGCLPSAFCNNNAITCCNSNNCNTATTNHRAGNSQQLLQHILTLTLTIILTSIK